jgi:hypothetical protein
MKNYELFDKKNLITWMNPEIYNKDELSFIEISLYHHTSESDGIRIKYESERDGWIIEQPSVFEFYPDDKDFDQDWQEVAFIKSRAKGKPDLT